MSPSSVTIVVSVAFVAAVSAVQWFATSPGRITYAETRLMILAGIPALVAVLSARWVESGARDR